MTEDGIRFPGDGGNASVGEAGLAAVRSRYGPDMVQRIRNWPKLAEVYAVAQYADPGKDVETAQREFQRARTDRDFALAQALTVARRIPKDQWTVVPAVAQLRREWGFDEPVGTIHRSALPPARFPVQEPTPLAPLEVDPEVVAVSREAARRARERLEAGNPVPGPDRPADESTPRGGGQGPEAP